MTRTIKIVLALLVGTLALSLVGNVVLYRKALHYYGEAEAVRLDPASRRHFQTEDQALRPPAPGQKRVVLLGDSRIERWQPLPKVDNVQFVNRGRGGDTTAQVRLRLNDILALKPDVVVVQVGINDWKTLGSLPDSELLEYCAGNLEHVVDRLAEAQIEVIVLTVFPVGAIEVARRPVWSDDTLAGVARLNDRLRQWHKQRVRVIDCDAFFAVAGRMNPAYQQDALHLLPEGYEALNQVVKPHLQDTLKKP